MFYSIDSKACRAWNVLELGCGVGRLAGPITSRVGTYTGFDISAGMVEEAIRRSAENSSAHFFLGDGLGLPAEAKDKTYELILVAAVFIHSPRSVIRQNVVSAFAQLSKGGELRLQVLADIEDSEGSSSLPETEVEGGPILDLVDATAGEVVVFRPTLQHMYAIVRAPV
ncbi:MAG: SAM-dependent methyltransferase [Planctomycetota bacterium]|jgi:SAM-dependent methyltransferase